MEASPPAPLQAEEAALAVWKSKLVSRNLPTSLRLPAAASSAQIDEAVGKMTQVRLDREGISCLHPAMFICLPSLSSLYLQQNQLESLRGIEEARQLRFLTVAGNQITAIEGLKDLQKLMFLDVSENGIQHISVEQELPQALRFLNVSQNPCCHAQQGLLGSLMDCLPNLKEVDGLPEMSFLEGCATAPDGRDLELDAEESFLEELERTMSQDPLTNEEEAGAADASFDQELKQLLKFNALTADAVRSLFESKSELLHKSFDDILERSRARLLEVHNQIEEAEQTRQHHIFKQGDARVKLQDFFAASAVAKELRNLEERAVTPE